MLDMTCIRHRYLITALYKQCLAYCAANVSSTNAVDWLIVADTHTIDRLHTTLFSNLAEIEVAVPNLQATLTAHPLLMCACFKASTSPQAVPRRKVSN